MRGHSGSGAGGIGDLLRTGRRMADGDDDSRSRSTFDKVQAFRPFGRQGQQANLPACRFLYFSTKAERLYTDWQYQPNDCLVFGRETRGLPEDLLRANWDRCLKIPMPNPAIRSLNLATSVGIVLYEALRQVGP